jgi:hypothetical protein
MRLQRWQAVNSIAVSPGLTALVTWAPGLSGSLKHLVIQYWGKVVGGGAVRIEANHNS